MSDKLLIGPWINLEELAKIIAYFQANPPGEEKKEDDDAKEE